MEENSLYREWLVSEAQYWSPPPPAPPRSSLVDRLADGGFLVVAGHVVPFDAVGVKIVQNSQAALKRYNFSIYVYHVCRQYLTVQGE